MSKVVKTVASVALPIIGTIVAPGIGTYLGSTLSGATLGAIGGALGGASGGAISGGNILQSAAMGGIGGYIGAGGLAGGAATGATTAGTTAATAAGTTSEALLAAPTGAVAGFSPAVSTGTSLASTVGTALTDAAKATVSDPTKLLGIGNQLVASGQAQAAQEAAEAQSTAANEAISKYMNPYTKLGASAANQIQEIQSDPTAYLQSSELYNTLASDAEQRLLANQAAKGKVASGGTASDLQSELLSIGSGLVNNQVNTLQNQVNTGLTAAGGSSNLATQSANATAAGILGSSNAYATGYQNQLNTLLALQSLSGSPTYQTANI